MYPFVWGIAWNLVAIVHYLDVGLYGALHLLIFIHVLQPPTPLTLK